MGDSRRQQKKWRAPRHPWRGDVLSQEIRLIGLYGLRNKRELWRTRGVIREIRHRAREVLSLPPELRAAKEAELLVKLQRMGLLAEGTALDDVLGLKVEDILERRVQTVILRKGLAQTPQHARQLIAHGHIRVGEHRITSPGFLVPRAEEEKITLTLAAEPVAQTTA
jgi:small subunit ribosomal protein S4